MANPASLGQRIRALRIEKGLKQSDLALRAGISASYLNLIEHDRRRIAGKLLNTLSLVLGVDPSLLSQGVEASVVARLTEVSQHNADGKFQDTDQALDIAARFPMWADLLISMDRKLRGLEQQVESLSDRLAHDPHLATSLHEVLTTVTAIRSTSSILADTDDIEPEWQKRFFRNINEDSVRLAEGAEMLVRYLDAGSAKDEVRSTPKDELDSFLKEIDYDLESLILQPDEVKHPVLSTAGQKMLEEKCDQMRHDLSVLPTLVLKDALSKIGSMDPFAISAHLNVSVPTVIRCLSHTNCSDQARGMVACDISGTFVHRRTIDGFHVPRYGAGCAIWPLFEALQWQQRPIARLVTHTGREGGTFETYSYSSVEGLPGVDAVPNPISYMLIVPTKEKPASLRLVGASCGVCSVQNCQHRKEPSIIG